MDPFRRLFGSVGPEHAPAHSGPAIPPAAVQHEHQHHSAPEATQRPRLHRSLPAVPARPRLHNLRQVFDHSWTADHRATDSVPSPSPPPQPPLLVPARRARPRGHDSAGAGLRRSVLVRNAMLSSLEREMAQMDKAQAVEEARANVDDPISRDMPRGSSRPEDVEPENFWQVENTYEDDDGDESDDEGEPPFSPRTYHEHDSMQPCVVETLDYDEVRPPLETPIHTVTVLPQSAETAPSSLSASSIEDSLELEQESQWFEDLLHELSSDSGSDDEGYVDVRMSPELGTLPLSQDLAYPLVATSSDSRADLAASPQDSVADMEDASRQVADSGYAEQGADKSGSDRLSSFSRLGYPDVCPYPPTSPMTSFSSDELPSLVEDNSDAEEEDDTPLEELLDPLHLALPMSQPQLPPKETHIYGWPTDVFSSPTSPVSSRASSPAVSASSGAESGAEISDFSLAFTPSLVGDRRYEAVQDLARPKVSFSLSELERQCGHVFERTCAQGNRGEHARPFQNGDDLASCKCADTAPFSISLLEDVRAPHSCPSPALAFQPSDLASKGGSGSTSLPPLPLAHPPFPTPTIVNMWPGFDANVAAAVAEKVSNGPSPHGGGVGERLALPSLLDENVRNGRDVVQRWTRTTEAEVER